MGYDIPADHHQSLPDPNKPLGKAQLTASEGDQYIGKAWNGFEWVTPERYNELRATSMPDLPPLQPTRAELAASTPAPEPQSAALSAASEPQARDHGHPPPCDGMDCAWHPPSPQELVRQAALMLVRAVDPNPDRSGLTETPERVAKAWVNEWASGYDVDIASLFKSFEDGAEGCDQMVVVQDIPVYSHCEHHLAAIFGTATVAYVPTKHIVGLSKLNRLVDAYARRLQVQERMTNQIADAIVEHLKPLGCGVVIKARHLCMESRGVRQAGAVTVSSALRGIFRDDAQVRAEFLSLARKGV